MKPLPPLHPREERFMWKHSCMGKEKTKREPRQETKPATYEKGDDYDLDAEEEA